MNALTHILIDGSGCPGFCLEHDHTPGVRTTKAHKGRAMRAGGVNVYPAILVETRTPPNIPPAEPRMRVLIEDGTRHLAVGMENGQRLADLLTVAGDETGLASAVRAALTTLRIEQWAADEIAAERHEQTKAAI